MANIDPFDIEFDDEEYNKPTGAKIDPFDVDKELEKAPDEKPSRSINKWKKALENQANKFKPVQKPSMRKMLYNNPEDANKFKSMSEDAGLSQEEKDLLKETFDNSEINVPEIDTKVVDLPKEDENEKELIVEHNEPTTETTTEPSGTTIAEPAPQEENSELENFDESEVVEPPTEENAVSGEEAGDKTVYPDTEEEPKKEEEPKEEKGEEKKEEEKDEEEPVMTDEEALAEAQEMAQDDLVGFKVTGKNWSKMTDKQKAEAIKAFKDKNKVEDHSTDIDNNETNNFESYKRYPTALRVAEDLAGAGGKIIEGAGDVAGTEIGGTGANMISERAKGVPHYDYTSLFGRR